MPAELDPSFRARLDRTLWLGWLVMLWERATAVWAPLALAAGAIAVAGLWGLFEPLPSMIRSILIAGVAVVAVGLSVRGLLSLRIPSREDARRRFETDARLTHRPLAALDDRPALGETALWAVHRAQAMDAADEAQVGRPRAGLAAADPFALRYALVIAAVLALWARGPERAHAALDAFQPLQQFASAGGRVLSTAGDKIAAVVTAQSSAAIPGKPRSLPAASRP